MESSNIKKDFDFTLRVLNNENNKKIHLPALQRLIKNFEKKWCDLLGPGIADFYTNRLNKKYNVLQYN
tara:strand:+ start:493 stop:696 length:204 start_codon:yes stop_codon:yes gene_type:complete